MQVSRASISAINVTVDEVCDFFSCLLGEWGCFWPSCESFDCYSNVAISSGAERKGSHQVDFPSVEKSFDWDWSCGFLVCGSCLQLTSFTVLDIVLDLVEDAWPPKTLVDGCESVVDTGMSFLVVELDEGLMAFFGFL